jgi:hypothetical protein
MKHIILLIVCVSAVYRTAFPQSTAEAIITLPSAHLSIEEVINQIKGQSVLTFTFGNKVVTNAKIKFSSTKLTVKQILDRIQEATGTTWQIKGLKVILKPAVVKHTINGYMRDRSSGENLIGGNIYSVPDLHGTTSNEFGHFSFTLPEGDVNIMASYVGYDAMSMSFQLKRDTTMDILLKNTQLEEVVITAEIEAEPIHERSQMSVITMPVQQLKSMPAMAGEVDVLRSLSLLPGVSTGSEGSTGLYVRGGGPDQNLILLDGSPVYNASHLFGFFSVFNADAINHVELIKGGFPARYGGRLSSVIDISMKEGNKEKLKGEGSVGIIGAKFTLEGPLKKDKATFIVSARRTYADLLVRPFLKKEDQIGYYFYDVNAKVNYKFNRQHRIYLSAYTGKDKTYSSSDVTTNEIDGVTYRSNDESDLGWGNLTSALRWNYVISPKLFSNITATYTRYHFRIFNSHGSTASRTGELPDEQSYRSIYTSGISDYALRADIDYLPTARQYVKTGIYAIHHTFNPGVMNSQSESDEGPFITGGALNTIEFGGYAEDDIMISNDLKTNVGVHVSGTLVDGQAFVYPQPRMALRYLVSPTVSIKASFATMAQYVHLLTNAGVGLPTDLWVPATSKVKPMRSQQVAIGSAWLPNKTYEFTAEAYYKKMHGVIEYKDGASYLNSQDWQNKVEIGNGESYGTELMLSKKLGRWTGWVGYTLSWTNRQFDNLNGGKKFPYRYDRRHDIELVLNRPLTKKIDFAANWVYATGNAISLPVAAYGGIYNYPTIFGQTVYNNLLYEGRNGFRLRAYHRLDASITFKKVTRRGERSWVVSFYNLYNRRNPFYVDFKANKDGYRRLYQYSLFGIIPSVTYNFKF